MAYIGHRCGCGHMDIHHKPDAARSACLANGGKSCGNGCRKNPKASVAPSFDRKGRPVERIVPPGERMGQVVKTCGCEACHALYIELTGATADSG